MIGVIQNDPFGFDVSQLLEEIRPVMQTVLRPQITQVYIHDPMR